jgi:hypothetical protein
MTKNTRTYRPCRVCGAEHDNPMSSSICPTCGYAEHVIGIAIPERPKDKLELLDEAATVEELKDWIKEFLL